MSSITFTTKDGENNIGNPMVLGFTSNKTETAFSETYDLELPPPPPPPLTNQLPDTSQYNTQLFISIENKSAYEYYIPEVITSSLSLQFVVRKAGGGLVTFTYNNSQIGQIFSVLEIVGESGVSIDLLTTTDNTGVTIDGTTNTVTLDSLAHGEFYTMNVQKFVEGPTRLRGNVNNDVDNDGNNVVDVADLVFLQKYLNGVTEQVTLADGDSDFMIGANVNNDVDADGNTVVDVADLVFLQKHLNQVSGFELPGTNFS